MEWISVKDKLPEKSGAVLVHSASGWMETVHYSATHKLFNAYDHNEKAEVEKYAIECTHWMPLPEPPKEAEE